MPSVQPAAPPPAQPVPARDGAVAPDCGAPGALCGDIPTPLPSSDGAAAPGDVVPVGACGADGAPGCSRPTPAPGSLAAADFIMPKPIIPRGGAISTAAGGLVQVAADALAGPAKTLASRADQLNGAATGVVGKAIENSPWKTEVGLLAAAGSVLKQGVDNVVDGVKSAVGIDDGVSKVEGLAPPTAGPRPDVHSNGQASAGTDFLNGPVKDIPLEEADADSVEDGAAPLPQVAQNRLNGIAAEHALAAKYPGAEEQHGETLPSGQRRVFDVLTPTGKAIESKVGRTSLTKRVRDEIAGDVEARQEGNKPGSTVPVRSAEWVFHRSPVTGKTGPTANLQKALDEAKIPWREEP